MVFQNYALYPNKTVYNNLAFPLQMRKLSDVIDKKVRDAAKVLDITHLLERGRANCQAASSSALHSGARWCATRRVPDG
jgi:ABC-type sugar transport system ATPase subunit